jgi:branched-chain amino acid transport system substrate-binding protein
MRTSVLAGSRALRGCLCAGLAAALAGCTAPASSNVTVSGKTLMIYAGVPPGGAGGQQTQDILDAEQLALQQAGSQFAGFTVKLVRLDGKKISDNARTAIQDKSAIAYVGEINPGSSADSIGITNAQDLLQVSPTDTAVELTKSTPAVPNAPTLYYESLKSYGRTFARVVPTTELEAKVLITEMQALHVAKLYVADDGSDYGKAVALAVKGDASPAITVVPSQSTADAVFYGGSSPGSGARFFNQIASSGSTVKLFGPSALADPAFVAALSPAAQPNVYVSSPGFYRDLTASGQKFAADFQAAYQHPPAPEAIFGYEAMASVLEVLREAGASANNRSTVVHDFFALKHRQSVLGTYSINPGGDTSLSPFVFSRVKSGQLVPFKSPQAQG